MSETFWYHLNCHSIWLNFIPCHRWNSSKGSLHKLKYYVKRKKIGWLKLLLMRHCHLMIRQHHWVKPIWMLIELLQVCLVAVKVFFLCLLVGRSWSATYIMREKGKPFLPSCLIYYLYSHNKFFVLFGNCIRCVCECLSWCYYTAGSTSPRFLMFMILRSKISFLLLEKRRLMLLFSSCLSAYPLAVSTHRLVAFVDPIRRVEGSWIYNDDPKQ